MAPPNRADGGFDHQCHLRTSRFVFSCFYLIAGSRHYPHMAPTENMPGSARGTRTELVLAFPADHPAAHFSLTCNEYPSVTGRTNFKEETSISILDSPRSMVHPGNQTQIQPTSQHLNRNKKHSFLRDKDQQSREMHVVIRNVDCSSGRLPRGMPQQQGYQHQTDAALSLPIQQIRILSLLVLYVLYCT